MVDKIKNAWSQYKQPAKVMLIVLSIYALTKGMVDMSYDKLYYTKADKNEFLEVKSRLDILTERLEQKNTRDKELDKKIDELIKLTKDKK